jgi:RNA polymerase sigma-70 factor (ECF subfamily)
MRRAIVLGASAAEPAPQLDPSRATPFAIMRALGLPQMSSDPAPAPSPPDEMDILIERCLTGDQDAWARIVQMHRRKVFNVAYKFVGRHEEAEDLTQDNFVKIFKALHTFDRRANFQTWLISISRNLCIDHYRSVRKERETMARDVDASQLSPFARGRSPYGELEHLDLRRRIREALAELPPALREAVVLRDLQEYAYQEIADRLGLPEGTVKSRINRGRHELARQLRRLESKASAGQPAASGGPE